MNNTTQGPPSEDPGALGSILLVFVAYIAPICYLQGIVGNAFALFIFIRSRKLRHTDILDYMFPLCAADMTLLIFGAMTTWLHMDMPNAIGGAENMWTNILSTSAACKIISYLGWLGGFCSSWVIVLFTWEKVALLSVRYTALWLTRKKRIFSIAMTILLGVLLMIPILVTYDIDDDGHSIECVYKYNDSQGAASFIGPFMLFFIIYLLPVFLICVGNGIMVWSLCAKKRHDDPDDTVDLQRQQREVKVIKQLLVISCFYLFCVTPAAIFDLVAFRFQIDNHVPSGNEAGLFNAFNDFVHRLIYMNNSFNYVAYIVTLDWFRREVAALCCPSRVRVDANELTEEAIVVPSQNYGGAYSRMQDDDLINDDYASIQ